MSRTTLTAIRLEALHDAVGAVFRDYRDLDDMARDAMRDALIRSRLPADVVPDFDHMCAIGIKAAEREAYGAQPAGAV